MLDDNSVYVDKSCVMVTLIFYCSENENDGHLDGPKITFSDKGPKITFSDSGPKITFTGGKANRIPTVCTTATCKENASSRQNNNCFGQSFIKMHSKEKSNKNADM